MSASKTAEKISDSSLTDLNWLQTSDEEQTCSEKIREADIKDLAALLPATGVQPPRSRGNQEGRPQLSFAGLVIHTIHQIHQYMCDISTSVIKV